MKLPTFNHLSKNAGAIFVRFPTLAVTAIVATALCCFLIDDPTIDQQWQNDLWLAVAVCNLLFTLGLSADLFSESRGYTPARKWLMRLAVIGVCVSLYCLLKPDYRGADIVRLGLFAFAFHQLVAFAPFINRAGSVEFWHFNKVIFLHFLTAVFYSAALFAGLAVAVFGVEQLFNLNLSSAIYGQLFAVLGIGFNTLFFLAGVPKAFDAGSLDMRYPKGLQVFTQYVLVPLMTIYLCILLVYEIKILVEWQLPKGMVATLILGYAVFGILSLLLIWPIKDDKGNRWVQLFSRFFYLTMIPLIILLGFAIYKRVSDYGVTEERYILIILGVWLTGVSIYFLVFRKDNIKIIPVSLFICVLLGTYGPQGAASVSRQSQLRRLAKLMDAEPGEGASGEKASIVSYLVEVHGLPTLQRFTEVDLTAVEQSILQSHTDEPRYKIIELKRDTAFKLLHVSPAAAQRQYFYVNREHRNVIPLTGYDYGYKIESHQAISTVVDLGGQQCDIQIDGETKQVKIEFEGDSTIAFDLKPLTLEILAAHKAGTLERDTSRGKSTYSYSSERMRLTGANRRFDVVFLIDELNGDLYSVDRQPSRGLGYSGMLLFRKR